MKHASASVLLSIGAFACSAFAQDLAQVPWCQSKCVAVGGPTGSQHTTSIGSPQGWIVGEIRTFAVGNDSQQFLADLAANGWIECAGQSVKIADYPELWKIMGRTWGSADKTNVFYLPDLRGMFLVGWNHGRVAPPKYREAPYTGDEDINSRIPPRPEAADEGGIGGPTDTSGAYIKDHVGMLEADQIRAHTHSYAYQVSTTPQQNAYDSRAPSTGMSAPGTATSTTSPGGGIETHPVNASVAFFIYLGHPSASVAASGPGALHGSMGTVVRAEH